MVCLSRICQSRWQYDITRYK